MNRLFYLLFLCSFWLVSCNNDEPQTDGADAASITLPDSLPRFDSIEKPSTVAGFSWIVEEKSVIESHCETEECSRISWKWFELGGEANPTLKDSINNFNWYYLTGIPGARKQDLDSIAASFFKEAKTDVPVETAANGWEEQNEVWPAFATANTFTLAGRVYFNNGGAGNYASHLENFDIATGNRINLQSVVSQPYMLFAIGELIFRKSKGIDTSTPLSQAGFKFPEDVFYLPETFGIHPEGLVFVYAPSEIASPTEGEQFVMVPYGLIAKELRPEFGYLAQPN